MGMGERVNFQHLGLSAQTAFAEDSFQKLLKLAQVGWCLWDCLGCIGDEILPKYIGIIVNNYKDPY